jgi:hypothetical protein
VTLNNRISFRDAYCAPGGGVVDLRVVPLPTGNNGNSSEATMPVEMNFIDPEKSQNDLIGQSAEVNESKLSDSHVMVPIFS